MSTQQIRHTVKIAQLTEGMDVYNRRATLNNMSATIRNYVDAGKLLKKPFDIVIINDPDRFDKISEIVFTFPVNPYFENPTADLFNSLFHRNITLDQYLEYECELVTIED